MSSGVGDKIAQVTSALGISQCEQCKLRQRAMNAVDWKQPIADVYRDLRLAATDPQAFLDSLSLPSS